MVTGIEPVFNDRLNPGNNLLVRITVSRYWRYYVVGCLGVYSSLTPCCGAGACSMGFRKQSVADGGMRCRAVCRRTNATLVFASSCCAAAICYDIGQPAAVMGNRRSTR